MTQPLPTLGVVVPAHDEQELLGACLDALSRAARWVAEGAVVRTVVVLDACRDGTADVARAYGAVYVDDWDQHAPAARHWFSDVYDQAGDPHPHVHGANLGMSAGAYEACGGFRGLSTGEDVALVSALDVGGFTVHRTRRSPVLTSGRRVARAHDGFAGRLAELAAAGAGMVT